MLTIELRNFFIFSIRSFITPHTRSVLAAASLNSPCLFFFCHESLSPMDPQDVIIAVALEAELERKRQKLRRMKGSLRARRVALREKCRERAMLVRKKQVMLAKEAAKQILVDDFMVFIEAIEGNGAEIAQDFDEEAMMATILNMMNDDDEGNSSDN